jgi:palmitoyltransferase
MLHKGAQGNSPNSIIYFNKKYNIDIASTNNDNLNAMHFAAISGMDNSIIYLLNMGLNPNLQDINGNTPIHYAVKYGQNRIIKKLLHNGADKNILNKNKVSPAMLARENPELSDIFSKKGICQKLFFKPDINKKSKFSNINMLLFIILHFTVIFLTFIMLMPYFDNTYFSILYLVISLLLFILFFILAFSDPGTLTNNKYKDALDIIEQGEMLEYYCPKCLIKMDFRTKHCVICEKCVDDFDHHCFWVGNCIGKKNFSLFFDFLVYVIFNTLFNFLITTYYVLTEMSTPYGEKANDAFPGFYFGVNSVIYNRTVRIVVSIFISAVCVLFFIPLIDLFQIQWSNFQERKQLMLDEEEYQKGLLNEKLISDENENKEKMEEEVWDDEKYDKEDEIALK